jgi:hypothetical protein
MVAGSGGRVVGCPTSVALASRLYSRHWKRRARRRRVENDVRTIWTRDRDYRRYPRIEVRDPFA